MSDTNREAMAVDKMTVIYGRPVNDPEVVAHLDEEYDRVFKWFREDAVYSTAPEGDVTAAALSWMKDYRLELFHKAVAAVGANQLIAPRLQLFRLSDEFTAVSRVGEEADDYTWLVGYAMDDLPRALSAGCDPSVGWETDRKPQWIVAAKVSGPMSAAKEPWRSFYDCPGLEEGDTVEVRRVYNDGKIEPSEVFFGEVEKILDKDIPNYAEAGMAIVCRHDGGPHDGDLYVLHDNYIWRKAPIAYEDDDTIDDDIINPPEDFEDDDEVDDEVEFTDDPVVEEEEDEELEPVGFLPEPTRSVFGDRDVEVPPATGFFGGQ